MALSIWEKRSFHAQPHLVVVGGGITGLFTALFHQRAHPTHRVLVVERGPFPSGASVRNAGFACFGSPSELLADIRTEGRDAALARVEERWIGLQELRAELGDAAIGFEATGGHEVYGADDPLYTRVAEGFDALNAELAAIFGRTVFQWDPEGAERNGLAGVAHMVRTDLEGGLHSGHMMATLLRKAQAEGVRFRGAAEVSTLHEGPHGVELGLANGEQVHAERCVVATNAWTARLILGADIVPARGQVVVTSPIPGVRLRGTFHADEGFYYFRDLACPEHPGMRRVLLGGGRNLDIAGETTLEEGTSPLVQERLERMLRGTILPNTAFTIEHRWSGIMGFRGKGKAPLVERIGERLVVAAGLSGMGVAIGIRVARRAAKLLER
jgi:glycine/D-amino acid oxidase-like deaminating enzyme